VSKTNSGQILARPTHPKQDEVVLPCHHSMATASSRTVLSINLLPFVRLQVQCPQVPVVAELVGRAEFSTEKVHLAAMYNSLMAASWRWGQWCCDSAPSICLNRPTKHIAVASTRSTVEVFPTEYDKLLERFTSRARRGPDYGAAVCSRRWTLTRLNSNRGLGR
jgi:hypothetical protein